MNSKLSSFEKIKYFLFSGIRGLRLRFPEFSLNFFFVHFIKRNRIMIKSDKRQKSLSSFMKNLLLIIYLIVSINFLIQPLEIYLLVTSNIKT